MSELVKKSMIKKTVLALCFALVPLLSSAAGLGKLNVFSALGEPLEAEIEVLSVSNEELGSLTANLGSADQYAEQGIDKTAAQQNIKVEVVKKPNGSPVIHLSSKQAVTEPFLDMLVQLVWNEGQLSREYTLLLDPPEYAITNFDKPTVESPKVISGSSRMEAIPSSAAIPLATKAPKVFKSSKRVAVHSENNGEGASTVTTMKGDSLSAIAIRNQTQDVNLDQMLVGIFKSNPDAFEGGNMNRLKVGQVIHIPSAEVLKSINQQEARAEVYAQVANWHSYVKKLSDVVANSEATDNDRNSQSVGKIVTKAEDKAAPPVEGPHDVVKLAKTDVSKTSNQSPAEAEAKNPEQKSSNLQDDLAAKENTIKETDEKSAAIEKQISDMKKLLALKNKSMADAQKAAEEAKQKTDNLPNILENVDPALASGMGALLLVLIIAWVWLRKKSQKQVKADVSPEVTEDLFTQSVADSIVGSTSFLNDYAPESTSLIDTHEVDPIAEAEVFLTYGRHAQAEDILKDAIQKSPDRYELHLKLLEIYAQVKNASAFELLAVELFSILGSNDPIWTKVSELGLQFDPENKLYHRAKDALLADAEAEPKLVVSDFEDADLMEEHVEASKELDVLDFKLDMDTSVDQIPLHANLAPDEAMIAKEADFVIVEETPVDLTSASELSKPLEIDLKGIDLNFESIPQFSDTPVNVNPIPDAFSGDFSNLLKVDIVPQSTAPSLKLVKETKADVEESADVATKLELAVAYIDMADKEGALELLGEALKEGGPLQRKRAQALIDSLA